MLSISANLCCFSSSDVVATEDEVGGVIPQSSRTDWPKLAKESNGAVLFFCAAEAPSDG